MVPEKQLESLVDAIKSARPRVSREILDEFQRDPFWEARYGEKGRNYILSDSGYHLDYLATALQAGDPQIYAGYWAWLRPLLVMRGMSTRHLRLTLGVLERRLSIALGDEFRFLPDYLAAAYAALAYRHPSALALANAAEAILADVFAQLELPVLSTWAGPSADQQQVAEKLSGDLAYLADTIEIARSELFALYFDWMENYLCEQGWQPAFTRQLLRKAMEAALNRLGSDLFAAFVPAVEPVFEPQA